MRVLFRPFGLAVLVATICEAIGFYGVLGLATRGGIEEAARGVILLASGAATPVVLIGTWIVAHFVSGRDRAGGAGRIALAVVLAPLGFAGGFWLWARSFRLFLGSPDLPLADAAARFGFSFLGLVLHGFDFAVLGLAWGLLLSTLLTPRR